MATQTLTKEDFIRISTRSHKVEYDYSKVEFTHKLDKVTIICQYHGEFTQQVELHMRGACCKQCNKEGRTGRGLHRYYKPVDTKESFVDKAIAKHGTKYTYCKVDYKQSTVPVIITCPEHGDFEQEPASHIRGRGCPTCARLEPIPRCGYKDKPTTLYYVSFVVNNRKFHKLGITTQSKIQDRFAHHKDITDFKVIDYLSFSTGEPAYNKEQELLNKFKQFRYKGKNVLPDGNTELLITDVLNGTKLIDA